MSEAKTNKSVSIHNRHMAGPGDVIVRQGETGNKAYLIQSGKVRVYAENDGQEKDLAILEAGQIFGEMALVIDEPRVASVEALENTSLIVLTRPMMIEKMGVSDVTIQAIIRMLVKRIKDGNQTALGASKNFADLSDDILSVYSNVENTLQGPQKKSLERAVKPQMDAFLQALQEFHDRYSEET